MDFRQARVRSYMNRLRNTDAVPAITPSAIRAVKTILEYGISIFPLKKCYSKDSRAGR